MDTPWNPDSPAYRDTVEQLGKTFSMTHEPTVHNVLGAITEFGLKNGATPTQLRATFEAALQYVAKRQEVGTGSSGR